jgi:hypothetical protein
LLVAHLLFTFLNHGGMDRACVLSCNHHQGLSLNIELTIFSVVWPWCFACAGSSSLHGWIHFTMNACAHAVGWLYMSLNDFAEIGYQVGIKHRDGGPLRDKRKAATLILNLLACPNFKAWAQAETYSNACKQTPSGTKIQINAFWYHAWTLTARGIPVERQGVRLFDDACPIMTYLKLLPRPCAVLVVFICKHERVCKQKITMYRLCVWM